MVREHLRVVLGTAERVEPRSRALVPLGAGAARDLAVGDLADEHVAERVLLLPADRGTALPAHELLPLERVQPLPGSLQLVVSDRAYGTEPEDLAEHRRVLEELLLLGRKPVEAGGDDSLYVL